MVLLRHHLKVLRLPTFGAEAEKVAAQCARDDADHLTYLLQLCELELLERDKRAAERRLKAARFPTFKSLETFDFTARPSVNKMLVPSSHAASSSTSVRTCSWSATRARARATSRPPSPRPRARGATRCGSSGPPSWSRPLIEARDERSFLRFKAGLAKLDLLVLDELAGPASKVGAELLFDVISTAYERTSLIVTTNLPFESSTEVLGSERLTGATLDRLTHRCRIIETKGDSYRLSDAKARARSTRSPGSVAKPKAPAAD